LCICFNVLFFSALHCVFCPSPFMKERKPQPSPVEVVFRRSPRVGGLVLRRGSEGDGEKRRVRKSRTWCEVKVVTMIVRYEQQIVSRTCGSVRSSLSAPARLVTVGSEAAETTTHPHNEAGTSARKFPATASVNAVNGARLDEMPNICELPQAPSFLTSQRR
jgi:hypothetical protein